MSASEEGKEPMTHDTQRQMLHVAGLRKRFGKHDVLRGVSFDVPAGSVVALLGSNGAGKTTTLKCILGVIGFEGDVAVADTPVRTHGKDARRRIGYVPQLPSLGESDTCAQALQFIADLKGVAHDRITPSLEAVNLLEQRDLKIGELSGGMRQRLALAAALLSDPPLLLLDEPTASLDIESKIEFHKLIVRLRDEGKTVLLSTHFFDHLEEVADRVLILHEGALVFDGTVDELRDHASGRRFEVHLNGHGPADLLHALKAAGIGPERVQSAAMRWEDILLATQHKEPPE